MTRQRISEDEIRAFIAERYAEQTGKIIAIGHLKRLDPPPAGHANWSPEMIAKGVDRDPNALDYAIHVAQERFDMA